MNYSFIHTADIHLDSPLRGLGAYSHKLSDCFRQASRQAFVNLVDAAITRQVAFVIISGDIFDGDWKDYSTGLFFVQQMGKLDRAGIPVYAISGNHDALTEVTKNLRYPSNVHMFDTRKPGTVQDPVTRAALHGQGFHDKSATTNIAREYPPPTRDTFNIGLLHTACEGCAEHTNYAPCSVEQLCNHGYDYWALGHVHGHAVLCNAPYVVFPGNLQGRHIRETGAKGYCLVEVSSNEVCAFEHVACDVARWCELVLDVAEDRCASFDEMLASCKAAIAQAVADADARPLAIRLTLTGATGIHQSLMRDLQDLRAQVEAVALSVSDEVMLEKLRVRTEQPGAFYQGTDNHGILSQFYAEIDTPEVEAAVKEELGEVLAALRNKLPNQETILPDDAELAEIMAEARAVVAAKLAHAGGAAPAN
jgi:exonuclease SbcD